MMRFPKALGGLLMVGVLVAACGGGSATQAPGGATQAPGGATQDTSGGGGGGGGATPEPQPTADNGGGGGGGGSGIDTTYGKVHIEIRGPIEKTADYGFIPAASLFAGAQGSSLSFTNIAGDELVSILVTAEGEVLVSYGGTDGSVPAAECTTSNWNIGATSGSGSFDCTAAVAIVPSGAMVQGVTIKGNFDARS